MQHLVEAVCDAVTILLANFGRREVSSDERERLCAVSVFNQPHDRVNWISKLQHFCRLSAKVIDDEHRPSFKFGKGCYVMGEVRNFASVHNSHTRFEILVHK